MSDHSTALNGRVFCPIGPSWKRKCSGTERKFVRYDNFPLPDGINSGPVLCEKEIVSPSLLSWSSSDLDKKPQKFTTVDYRIRKNITGKFPLEKSLPCMLPLKRTISTDVIHPTPVNEFGNTLSSFSLSDSQYLMFPEVQKDCSVVKMCEISSCNNTGGAPMLEIRSENELEDQFAHVCQVDSAVVGNTPYVLVRSNEGVSVRRLEEYPSVSSSSSTPYFVPLQENSSATLHKSLHGHFATVSGNENVNIYNTQRKTPCWSGLFASNYTQLCQWLDCEFGSHPLHLNVISETDLWLIDARSNLSRRILNIKEMGKFIHKNSEVICSFKGVSNSPIFYLNCSETVLMMDSRYCAQPLLSWQHMLTGKPRFPHIYDQNGMNLLVMANLKQDQLCIIPSKLDGANPDSVEGISFPKHFSIMNDTVSYAHNHGLWHSYQMDDYVKPPTVGITIILPEERENPIVCLQNNLGTVFYQSFSLNQGEEVPPAADEDSRAITNVLKQFEKEVCTTVYNNFSYKSKRVKVKYVEGLKRHYRNHKRETIHKPGVCSSMLWDLNRSFKFKSGSGVHTLFEADANALSRIKQGNPSVINYFHEKCHQNLDRTFLRSCPDPLSKTLLAIWDDTDSSSSSCLPTTGNSSENNESDSRFGFLYKRFPFITNDNISIPHIKLEPSGDVIKHIDIVEEPLPPPSGESIPPPSEESIPPPSEESIITTTPKTELPSSHKKKKKGRKSLGF